MLGARSSSHHFGFYPNSASGDAGEGFHVAMTIESRPSSENIVLFVEGGGLKQLFGFRSFV